MISAIKKIGFSVLFTAISVLQVNAQNATSWKFDKAHTSVNFSVKHFFSAVTGKFSGFEGNVNFDPANLQASKVDFSIDVKTVNTDDSKRDRHLQSADFFDAKIYPTMNFVSSKFEKNQKKNT